ncbi:biotin--[acetyl-CoA-carboxylase] ligase [Zoogloea sp.]|uniref:biotin--[acetyl-CoA-carboxylase] ligase n=1 Tax=Zoogloea sp. TaxID=49181 RepID=UPI002621DA42|nr:biotin--[acetyl-CoA-carboxylase] ligase [Zoogloea sp.]MDD3353714.1 biotin--[acetyl-CoA-carboxylase] ligase [Zoogloea sp.]
MHRTDYEALDAGTVAAALGRLADTFSLTFLAECDSTNSRLAAHAGPVDERIPVLGADVQTAGRGRRGRVWQSWPGASLTFSLAWRFAPGSPAPAGLSLVAGLAVARALQGLGVEGVQLKWPNDVLIHGRKLAGILIELSSGGGGGVLAVIGIGINRHLPADAKVDSSLGVIDLAECLASPPGPNALLAAVLVELHHLLSVYADAGFEVLKGAWEQLNAFADLPVRILGEAEDITGDCVGVDQDGALLLRTETGLQRILSGDVSLRVA